MSERVSKSESRNDKKIICEYIALEQENTALESVFNLLFEQVENEQLSHKN